MSEEVKPVVEDTEGKAPSETITIRVRDQTGEETSFKVKTTTRMEKVFSTYAQRKGVQTNQLRFLLDGERVEYHHTPGGLDMQEQDIIDCMLEQQGGCFINCSSLSMTQR